MGDRRHRAGTALVEDIDPGSGWSNLSVTARWQREGAVLCP